MYIVLALSSVVTKLPKKTLIFMTFKGRQINSMTFQAWKMKFLNSMTFHVFHDLYEPCVKHFNQSFIKSCRFTNPIINNKSKNTKKSPQFFEIDFMQNTKHALVWYNLSSNLHSNISD